MFCSCWLKAHAETLCAVACKIHYNLKFVCQCGRAQHGVLRAGAAAAARGAKANHAALVNSEYHCNLKCVCRYVDVRNMACYVLEQLLLLVGPKLNHEARRAIYPELLKRLDDSSNPVSVFISTLA